MLKVALHYLINFARFVQKLGLFKWNSLMKSVINDNNNVKRDHITFFFNEEWMIKSALCKNFRRVVHLVRRQSKPEKFPWDAIDGGRTEVMTFSWYHINLVGEKTECVRFRLMKQVAYFLVILNWALSFFCNFRKFQKKTISEISEHSENPVSEFSKLFPKFPLFLTQKQGFLTQKLKLYILFLKFSKFMHIFE